MNHTYIAAKKLQDEGGHTAVDSNEDVDAGQDHIGRAGDLKEERRGVHQRSYGPAVEGQTQQHRIQSFRLMEESQIQQQAAGKYFAGN